MYEIVLSKKAQKDLRKIGQANKAKVLVSIIQLENAPTSGKKLRGNLEGCRSLRVWPYRIIDTIYEDENTIMIIRIRHR